MQIVVRAFVMYVFILLLLRGMGKKELSSLTAFELVLLVVMGDLVQQGITLEDESLTGSMLAIGTIGLLVIGASYLSFRWARTRHLIGGLPVVLVRNGTPIAETLRRERLDIEELMEAARAQGIADLREVAIGLLEPDGKFSFIKVDRSGDQPPEQERLAV
jgi:uncharacterized membrane protein YcaP (DUF421 family)